MKSSILAISTIVLIVSCKLSPEQKAKKLIDKRLELTLHDYKSYQSVQFSRLDSAYTRLIDDISYMEVVNNFDSAKRETSENLKNAEIYAPLSSFSNKAYYYNDLAQKGIKVIHDDIARMDSLRNHFKPHFMGWAMEHSFRAKNLNGNLGIHHYMYYFDSSLSQVIKDEDVADNTKYKSD